MVAGLWATGGRAGPWCEQGHTAEAEAGRYGGRRNAA